MFLPISKRFALFYLSFVFLSFPLAGTFLGEYPLWTLPLTLLFAAAYWGLIHLQTSYVKTIAGLWSYVIAYITFAACFLDGGFIWFFFFISNLLIWRFEDTIKSYRFISFLLALFMVFVFGQIFASDINARIMVSVVPIFILIMTYFLHRSHVENQLRREINRQNQTIAILSTENERNRIRRDLHDTLGHTFAMLSLKTELAQRLLEKNKIAEASQELKDINRISKATMKDIRDLVNNLSIPSLDETLDQISQMLKLSQIDYQLNNQLDLEVLSPSIQSDISMILRELVTNIVKHAKANHCQITLKRSDVISIEVTDDGQGFADLRGDELHSIKERLSLNKGDITIVSISQPTKIIVTLEEGEKDL